MSLREFYDDIGGDLEAARSRFYNEQMLQKFLLRFLDEPSCEQMNEALARNDCAAAVKHAHTLAGQARSFGFTKLAKEGAALVQALRDERNEEIPELRYAVTTEYIRITRAIRSLYFGTDGFM